MVEPRRVVLDTNIILSALRYPLGRTATLRGLWHRRVIAPLVSRETTQELVRVLHYPKFKLSPDEQQELLADYLPYTLAVETSKSPNALNRLPLCADVDDQMFLELAQAGDAEMLITGDKELLELNDPLMRRMGFVIVTPQAAIEQLGH